MLEQAQEEEEKADQERNGERRDERGHGVVVGKGYLAERPLVPGVGAVKIGQQRVRDRREGERFRSEILPGYLRGVASIDGLIRGLYLKGISTGDFSEAVQAILGEQACGMSATNVVRLKKEWEEEYREWSRRDLSGKHYVYVTTGRTDFTSIDTPYFLILIFDPES